MKINNLFNVEGKVAVVTGGSRGIGEMISAGFLANGVKVYITARKAPALIEKANELTEKYDQECIAIPCDLSSKEGIDDFVSQISQKEDGIDFLINNAGAAWGEPFESFSEGGWDKVMDLNVKSLFFLTQKMKSLLTNNATLDDPSRVINIGSIDGLNVPALPTFSYSASKDDEILSSKYDHHHLHHFYAILRNIPLMVFQQVFLETEGYVFLQNFLLQKATYLLI